MSPKPPTFRDFFSDSISPLLELKPMTKTVRVKVEETILPLVLPEATVSEHTTVVSNEIGRLPKHPRYDELRVLTEDWNTYKLSDETILRLRMILLKVKIRPQAGAMPDIGVEPSSLLMAVYSSPKLKGPPSTQNYSLEELTAAIVEPNLKHQVIKRTVNEYETTGGLKILFQITSITVGRTNKYDREGDPMYVVNVESMFRYNSLSAEYQECASVTRRIKQSRTSLAVGSSG